MKDIYQTFTPEELAADSDFIDWIKKESDVDTQQWKNWLDANPQSQSIFDEARIIVEDLKFAEVNTQNRANEIWARIETSIEDENNAKSSGRGRIRALRYLVPAIAASLLLLLYFQFVSNSSFEISTAAGQDLVHQLPDASTIYLNDESVVAYDQKNYETHRTLHLDGEAFFEVEKGAAFEVATVHGTVHVLGTSFNVFSRKSGFEVRCHTGKVKVVTAQSSVELFPGQRYRSDSGESAKGVDDFDQINAVDWRQGFFTFEDEPLKNVLAEMERQFKVKVTLDSSLSDMPYTGFFEQEDLEQALYSICWPLNLKSQVNQQEVIISRK